MGIDINRERQQAAIEAAHRQALADDEANREAMRAHREVARAQYFATAALDSGQTMDPVTYALKKVQAAHSAILAAHDELAHGSAQVAAETLRAYIDEWI